ncbi:DUF4232 domain-containing protein [Mycobacterium sp. MBM]|nr:DUF4232 domain-containing protein [Mycobacterium sp. MBM]
MNMWNVSLPVAVAALLAGCASAPAPQAGSADATTPPTTSQTVSPVTATVTAHPPSPAATAVPPEARQDAAPCADTDLVVSHRPPESQGSEYRVVLLFENVTSKACTLQGYPGADIVDKDGPTLHVERRQQIAAPLLTLAPGEIATADLQASDVHRETESPCENWGLVVITAPNMFQQRQLDLRLPMCSALISSVT